MKKLLISITLVILLLGVSIYSFAANEYNLSIIYSGDVVENEEKNVDVVLTGENGPLFTNVRINVIVDGPATPEFIATDSEDNEINILDYGYWGPVGGFAIQGDFTNITHVTATFPKAGEYNITLNLVNLSDNSNVLATTTETINVLPAPQQDENNVVENNVIEELPTAGTTVGQYAIYTILIATIFTLVYFRMRKVR